jgi:hypothetical protein
VHRALLVLRACKARSAQEVRRVLWLPGLPGSLALRPPRVREALRATEARRAPAKRVVKVPWGARVLPVCKDNEVRRVLAAIPWSVRRVRLDSPGSPAPKVLSVKSVNEVTRPLALPG